MVGKANVIDLEPSITEKDKEIQVELDSGRKIMVSPGEEEELLEVVDPKGEVILTIRLTDEGPVITIKGARLELKSTEAIDIEAKKIRIRAEEEAVVESGGLLNIDSIKKMDISSKDDIRIEGKMIRLN